MQPQIETVINQILMLFLLIGSGWLMRRLGVLTDGVLKGLNGLILSLMWPMLMISTTQKAYTPELLATFIQILLTSALVLGTALSLLIWAFKRKGMDATPTLSMLCTMPNSGFFGIPIVQALYGDTGLLYLSAYIIGFNVVLWTIPMVVYAKLSPGKHGPIWKNLLNPGIVFAAIGMGLFLLKIALPSPVLSTVNTLASTNTPLSMLILGARMDGLKIKGFGDSRLWLCTAIKLVALPLLAMALLLPFGIRGMTLTILVVVTAMPTAASVQMMAERYGGDVELSAKTVSVTTLCSAVSLPLMLALTGLFG